MPLLLGQCDKPTATTLVPVIFPHGVNTILLEECQVTSNDCRVTDMHIPLSSICLATSYYILVPQECTRFLAGHAQHWGLWQDPASKKKTHHNCRWNETSRALLTSLQERGRYKWHHVRWTEMGVRSCQLEDEMPYLEKGVVTTRCQLASQLDMAIQPAGSRKQGYVKNKMSEGGNTHFFASLPSQLFSQQSAYNNTIYCKVLLTLPKWQSPNGFETHFTSCSVGDFCSTIQVSNILLNPSFIMLYIWEQPPTHF